VSYEYTRFRPDVRVSVSEDDGTLSYTIDWSDCCEGDFDEDGDGIGYDYSDNAWDALMNLMKRHPALLGYPNAYVEGRIVNVENPEADPWDGRAVAPRVRAVATMATCSFYSPAQARIEAEGAVPLEHWPFGKHFPYGVCTNPAMVGHGGFGPCRVDHPSRMKDCQVYVAQPLVRRGEVTVGRQRFVLESGRAGQGLVHWKLSTTDETKAEDAEDRTTERHWSGLESETQAREVWAALTGDAPIDAIEAKQTKPFIKSLVGACHGSAA
jgi:hypothetical protein